MSDMVAALEQNGHTYRSDGSIYFRIATLPDYGKLARLDHAGIQAGRARRLRQVRQGERPRLRAVEGDQARRADLGLRRRPRPSRLAHRVLGDGAAPARRGADRHPLRRHRPRSSRTTRTRSRRPRARRSSQFARFWFHVEHLLMDDGEKMSKSLGNVFTVQGHARAGLSRRRRCATCCCRCTTASS